MGVRPGHSSLRQKEGYRHLRINAWKSPFISQEHKTNEYVWIKAESLTGQQGPLLSTVKWQKHAWFGHVAWHDGLCKMSCKALSKADAGRDDNVRLGQTMSKHGWTCQQCNSWWPPPKEHPGVDCLLMLLLLSDPQMTRSVKGMTWHDMTRFDEIVHIAPKGLDLIPIESSYPGTSSKHVKRFHFNYTITIQKKNNEEA